MEESKILFQTLNSSSKWVILSIVYRHPGLSGRKIFQLSGMGWVPIRNSLEDLYRQRFILRRKSGRSYLYFPNEEHIFFPLLKEFFEKIEEIHVQLYYDLRRSVFQENDNDLLALKISSSHLYLVTRKEGQALEKKVATYLKRRGLEFLLTEIIPFKDLEKEKYKNLPKLPGKICGLPLLQLLKLI